MTEIRIAVRAPDEEELGWIAQLYGVVDPKYGSPAFLHHQFVENPLGWSVHVFALENGEPVAHTAAIPCRARRGGEELLAGKVEALVVAASHRGRRADGSSLAVEINERLHEAAHAAGIPVLFALATAQANRVFERAGFRPVSHGVPSYVLVTDGAAAARGRGSTALAVRAIGIAQRAALALARTAVRLSAGRPEVLVTPAATADAELARADQSSRWTIAGSDAWSWYAASGLLQAVEIAGPFGAKAIVRLPRDAADEAPAQIVAWRPRREGLLPPLLLLLTVARLARAAGAATLRFQPWAGPGGDTGLPRACRILVFLRRRIVELELHGEVEFDEVALTPFFYVTF